MKFLYILGVFLILLVLGVKCNRCSSGFALIGASPQLMLSIGEENPATNPSGTSNINLTIADEQGNLVRSQKKQLISPGNTVFQLNSGELVTQLDVETPDQMHYRLRYPKLDSPLKLDNYYSNWFGDQDSNWTSTWCNETLTGTC